MDQPSELGPMDIVFGKTENDSTHTDYLDDRMNEMTIDDRSGFGIALSEHADAIQYRPDARSISRPGAYAINNNSEITPDDELQLGEIIRLAKKFIEDGMLLDSMSAEPDTSITSFFYWSDCVSYRRSRGENGMIFDLQGTARFETFDISVWKRGFLTVFCEWASLCIPRMRAMLRDNFDAVMSTPDLYGIPNLGIGMTGITAGVFALICGGIKVDKKSADRYKLELFDLIADIAVLCSNTPADIHSLNLE